MKIYKPLAPINFRNRKQKSVFLAGSIENGKAIDWQTECGNLLVNSFEVFNPRRDNWNSNLENSSDCPEFYLQVNWELDALENADYVLFYFAPNTKSPISLLELGLFAKSKKTVVVCPDGFWRKGNVDIVCMKFDIPQFNTIEKAVDFLKN